MTITRVHDGEPHMLRMVDQYMQRTNPTSVYALPQQCSYCGSLHPADVLALLKAGTAKLSLADMKYGYPHKFYIEFPNPKAGEDCISGWTTKREAPLPGDTRDGWRWEEKDGVWHGEQVTPAPKIAHAKFYGQHIEDCPADMFEELSDLILLHTGVRFSRDVTGRLCYAIVKASAL